MYMRTCIHYSAKIFCSFLLNYYNSNNYENEKNMFFMPK